MDNLVFQVVVQLLFFKVLHYSLLFAQELVSQPNSLFHFYHFHLPSLGYSEFSLKTKFHSQFQLLRSPYFHSPSLLLSEYFLTLSPSHYLHYPDSHTLSVSSLHLFQEILRGLPIHQEEAFSSLGYYHCSS